MNRIAEDLGRVYHYDWRIFLVSLRDEIVGKSQRMLVVLLGAVAFVLLIACVNVAGLLLVRATSKRRDMAVRAALGASRMRLISASVAESLVLALAGAAGGSLVAWWGIVALSKQVSGILPRAAAIRIDPELFAYTLALSLVTGLIFGLAPAMLAARAGLNQRLREGGRGTSASDFQARVRGVLVVGEIALASALLIGAGLFLRSFVNLLRLDPGFQTQNVITATVVLPGSRYKDDPAKDHFFHDYLARISNLPGVLVAVILRCSMDWMERKCRIQGGGSRGFAHRRSAREISFGDTRLFPRHGHPAAGRPRHCRNRYGTAPYVIVVNQSMARLYWPRADAIGKRITFTDHPQAKDWFTESESSAT